MFEETTVVAGKLAETYCLFFLPCICYNFLSFEFLSVKCRTLLREVSDVNSPCENYAFMMKLMFEFIVTASIGSKSYLDFLCVPGKCLLEDLAGKLVQVSTKAAIWNHGDQWAKLPKTGGIPPV